MAGTIESDDIRIAQLDQVDRDAAPSRERRTSVFFIVPPVWELSFQSLGIPAMVAWSRGLGYQTEAADLNIAFHRFISGTESLDLKGVTAAYHSLIADQSFLAKYMPRQSPEKTRLPLPFGFGELVCNNYSRIESFIDDELYNPFLRFARSERFIDRIAAAPTDGPLLIGMGWDGENQVIATLSLAREIKRRRPDAIVVVGGPWATAMRDALRDEGRLLRDIDALIPKKGEAPFAALLSAVDRCGGLPDEPVDGVMTNGGDVFTRFVASNERIQAADLPRPILFPLVDYLRSNVLPYESERGCYWGKCRFCHHILTYTHGHNSKPIGKVIDDLNAYRSEHDFEVVAFVDAAMPPKRVREIAETFLTRDMDLRWAGFCRPERAFTAEIFQVAKSSGLDVLSFGVEHASERVLTFIGKPQKPEDMRRVLRACADAGIYTTAGVMNGLPSERYEDLDMLLDFLDSIKDFTYLHPHMFKFERGSEFFENAELYGLRIIDNHPESRLSIYFDFEDRNGGETRAYIKDTNFNQVWWRDNIGRTLDWKSQSRGFCKAVEFIVDH